MTQIEAPIQGPQVVRDLAQFVDDRIQDRLARMRAIDDEAAADALVVRSILDPSGIHAAIHSGDRGLYTATNQLVDGIMSNRPLADVLEQHPDVMATPLSQVIGPPIDGSFATLFRYPEALQGKVEKSRGGRKALKEPTQPEPETVEEKRAKLFEEYPTLIVLLTDDESWEKTGENTRSFLLTSLQKVLEDRSPDKPMSETGLRSFLSRTVERWEETLDRRRKSPVGKSTQKGHPLTLEEPYVISYLWSLRKALQHGRVTYKLRSELTQQEKDSLKKNSTNS